MTRSIRAGGRIFHIVNWPCKYNTTPKGGCNCCMPKDALHPTVASRPVWAQYAIPNESKKSKAWVFRPGRSGSYDGRAK